MASFRDLRHQKRPVSTGRFRPSGIRSRLVLIVVLVLTASSALFAASQLARLGTNRASATPEFMTSLLGAPQPRAPLTRTPARGVAVEIDRNGYTVASKGSSVTLSAEGVDGGAWRRFGSGVSRETSFGAESVWVAGDRRRSGPGDLIYPGPDGGQAFGVEAGAEGYPQKIEDELFGLVHDLVRQLFESKCRGEAGEGCGGSFH